MGYTVSWLQLPFSVFTYEAVLKVDPMVVGVKFHVKPWGFVVGDTIDDSVAIERVPTQMTFVKTNRMPYTRDVMKTLIVMVEFGAAQDLNHDDSDMTEFLVALDEVHAKRPLATYEAQKDYFTQCIDLNRPF
jgi:hypothetical protein